MLERSNRPVLGSFVVAGLCLVSVLCACTDGETNAPRRPNILFLMTDDQRFDELGSMGNAVIQTPNIDGLAAEGVVFENAFVTTSICASSRASILTGQHMRRHGIVDFEEPLSSAALDRTFPVILRAAGYRTGFVGKYAIGNWRESPLALPADRFDAWTGFPQSMQSTYEVEGERVHVTPLLTARALEFLRTQPADRPFLLSVHFKAPHGTVVDPGAPNPYTDRALDDVAVPSRADFDAEPEFLRRSLSGTGHSDLRGDASAFRKFLMRRYRLITRADQAIGEILAEVERLGFGDDTIVIFTSDNGRMLGDHGLFGKWIMYESSIRVPLIIRDPRAPEQMRGRRRDEMALNIDLAPTVLAMAGVAAPSGIQGRDLGPLLAGAERSAWRDDWYYEHVFTEGRDPIARCEGVRTPRWKYILYPDQDPPYEQLFDLVADPGERRNLAADAAHAEQLERLRERSKVLGREAR